MADVESKVKGLFFDGEQWKIDKVIQGIRVQRWTGTADYMKAVEILARAIAPLEEMRAEEQWRQSVEQMESNSSSWLYRTYRSMQLRGRNNGKGCSVTLSEFKVIVLASNGRCAITRIQFSNEKPAGARAAPWGMSVDRIDSSQGYHFDNVRIVCLAVNMAMREWGTQVMARIGRVMLLQELQREERNPYTRDFEKKTA